MSKWKGPFEELYYKALSDGAQDIATGVQDILSNAGLNEEQVRSISTSFQEHASKVHQRHAYTRGMLMSLPRAPQDRMQDSLPYDVFIPG